MKKVFKLVVILPLILIGATAYGGSCENCVIESIGSGPSVDNDCASATCVIIRVNAAGGNMSPHSCATSTAWNFVMDTTDGANKTTLTLLLTALATGKRVVIAGSNTCNNYSSKNVEDFTHMYFYW